MIERTKVLILGEHELLPALVKYYVEVRMASVETNEMVPSADHAFDFGIIGINSQSMPQAVSQLEHMMLQNVPILALINSDIYPCVKELPSRSKHGMIEYGDIILKPGDFSPIKYLAAEAMLAKHKKPVIVLRTFDTYGPNVASTLVNWVSLATKGAALPVIGDGEQKRTFLYVDDFLEAVDRVETKLRAGESGTFNIGATEAISYKRLGYYVWTMIYGVEEGLAFTHLPDNETHSWKVPNIQSIQDFIGWSPKISLRRGLFNLISHVQKGI